MKMSVVVATAHELEKHIPAWNSLAENAIERNPFYESWMLVPALRFLSTKERLIFVLVYAHHDNDEERGLLCGFFPLEQQPRYRFTPLPYLRLWKHEYCFLCTPLLRSGSSVKALNAFFDWAGSEDNDHGIVEFGSVSSDGCFHDSLQQSASTGRWPIFFSGQHVRPFLAKPSDPEQYLRDALSAKHLRALGRYSRKLSEEWDLSYVSLKTCSDVRGWIRSFLQLEASGWKGQAGTAMNCRGGDRDFFENIVLAAFNRNQLQMEGLKLGDRLLASRCCFRSGRGMFLFKVAFDEEYSRYSPGMQLEVESIRRLSEAPDIDWADSCAAENHPMWSRLWKERRPLETIAVAVKGTLSRRTVSLLPAARKGYLAVRRMVYGLAKRDITHNNKTTRMAASSWSDGSGVRTSVTSDNIT